MEDSDIIELFFMRSENAVAETKKKYGGFIRSLAMRILKSKPDAEECENDTYMGVWEAIPPQKPGNFMSFIAGIARNQALKKYNYINAEKRNPRSAVYLEELGDCIGGGDETSYSDGVLREAINAFLAGLNEETRRVFMLRYWYFASIGEITERCGISKSKAESMLFRTRKKLKVFLEERGII
ncbi:MAG: sigma-70 family RNA polymerase sigma factor [Ruminococcus sp.]|nr:sigma-70 family RNA polymerase sigma factor [Ruminococcus sp.]MCM1380461.1 sigma-70 family RNA polymerase sigma factor [Muribaculaceae bacterium]MCM1479624.1 sigma-70 family RNA polymerase sigma factor [Muribaculaceae bacterium]